MIDISHGIARHDVRQGAAVLADAVGLRAAGRAPRRCRPGRRHAAPRDRRGRRRGGPALRRPRQRPARRRRSTASAAPPRPSTSPTRPPGWSRSRRPSTAATCSPRSPRTSRSATRCATIGEPIDHGSLERARPRAARRSSRRRAPDGRGRRRRRVRQCRRCSPAPPTRTTAGLEPGKRLRVTGAATLRRGRSTRSPSPTSGPRASRAPGRLGGSLALAVNRGDAARTLDLEPGDRVALTLEAGVSRVRAARTSTSERPARPTTSPASWPRRGRRAGTVVTAGRAERRRGRRGRVWSAPPGKALLFSAILRPLELATCCCRSSVPVAVCEAVESLAPGVEARIKWPNDVWIDEAKVAGVLIEARPAGVGGDRDRRQRRDRRRRVPRRPALAGDLGRPRRRCRRCAPCGLRCARPLGRGAAGRRRSTRFAPRRARRPRDRLGGRGTMRTARASPRRRRARQPGRRLPRTASASALGSGEVTLRLREPMTVLRDRAARPVAAEWGLELGPTFAPRAALIRCSRGPWARPQGSRQGGRRSRTTRLRLWSFWAGDGAVPAGPGERRPPRAPPRARDPGLRPLAAVGGGGDPGRRRRRDASLAAGGQALSLGQQARHRLAGQRRWRTGTKRILGSARARALLPAGANLAGVDPW